MPRTRRTLSAAFLLVALAGCNRNAPPAAAPRAGGTPVEAPAGGFRAAAGQTVYVPAYPSIPIAESAARFDLAVTLSVRNTDRARRIVLTSVTYYDQDGNRLAEYLKTPLAVAPLAAAEFFVRERDTRGGVSASFLVDWLAEEPVTDPVVEAVMVGTAGTQGISFVSAGRPVEDRRAPRSPAP